ncbi:MAG: EscT/YscT/HrcT family type III secretion system export apparatus protein, partial [Myxococcota bacterium]
MSPELHTTTGGLHLLFDLAFTHLPAHALTAARLIPIVWLAPSFGGRLLPAPARLCLALCLCFVLAPLPAGDAPTGLALMTGIACEATLGLVLGLLASLPFELARSGGHLIDTMRGTSFSQVIAPGLQGATTPVGDLLYLALLVALTTAGGDRLLIETLAECVTAMPPGAIVSPGTSLHMSVSVIDATTALLRSALLLAAPPLFACLLADLVLGVAGRLVPQLPLFFLGM